jgi:F-type H+-transporting ATPase subunit a
VGNIVGVLAAKEVDFMIHGLIELHLFGQDLWITTTHVSVLIVCLVLILFAVVVRRRKAWTASECGGAGCGNAG